MSEVKVTVLCNRTNPTPDDIPAFVPYACAQLTAPFTVKFKSSVQVEYVSKGDEKNKKTKKSMAVLHQIPASDSKEDSIGAITKLGSVMESDEIVVTVVTDTSERLLGLSIERCGEVPRLLMQVIGLCVPFCPTLTSLSLRLCRLDGTVLYEIAKLLPQSQITDLCLDDSRVVPSERCYFKLLEGKSKLRSLSLARCSLADDDIALLVQKLKHPLPASKTLAVLNLNSNFISNLGARSIGECLRMNRSLQYLNLAGNQIGDTGAAEIIKSLSYFPLTADEIIQKKKRFVDYLKMRQDVFSKFYKELGSTFTEKALDDSKFSKRRGPDTKVRPSTNVIVPLQKARRSSRDIIEAKAQAMAEEFIGSFYDPYCSEETFYQDNYIYCAGNMSLCYLNFAYNNLGYLSLKRLLQVVKYQSNVVKYIGTGLLQVQIQGNNMPECVEMYMLQDWLEQAVLTRTTRAQTPRRQVKTKK